jgi:transcription factor E2F7/8
VNLDDCKAHLGIERRRIYDIVNILESFEMIKRRAKNLYCLQPPQIIKKRIERIEVR